MLNCQKEVKIFTLRITYLPLRFWGMLSLHVLFCPKRPNINFTVMLEQEKQQILTYENLKQASVWDFHLKNDLND